MTNSGRGAVRCERDAHPGCLGPKLCGAPAVSFPIMNATPQKRKSPSATSRALRQPVPGIVCCGIFALLAGCASGPDSYVLSAPPPPAPAQSVTTTTTTTTGQPAPGVPTSSTVVVTQAPPAVQHEAVLAQPSSEHVWIAGYWTWQHDRYVWIAGHWELPPDYAVAWVAPRWEREGRGYRFYEGYWQ